MDVSTEDTFEIISTYFSNIFWNKLYSAALQEWREEKFKKIEDAYQNTIVRYNQAFGSPDQPNERRNAGYKRVVEDLYTHYRRYVDAADTLSAFLCNISAHFFPQNQHNRLSAYDTRRESAVRSILTRAVAKFTLYVQNEGIKIVTNPENRKNAAAHVDTWKRQFTSFLTQEKNAFCSILLASENGINPNQNAIPMINKEVFDRLQNKIKTLITEKADLVKTHNNMTRYVQTLTKIVKDKEEENIKLRAELLAAQQRGRARPAAPMAPTSAPVSAPVMRPTTPAVSSAPAPMATAIAESEALEDLKDAEYEGEDIPLVEGEDLMDDLGEKDFQPDD